MKKTMILLLLTALLCGCSAEAKYKRIDISAQTLDGEETDLEKTVGRATKVSSELTETFSETMPIYEITPRKITDEELKQFAEYFGIRAEAKVMDSRSIIEDENGKVSVDDENDLTYDIAGNDYDLMTQSDEAVIEEAWKIFSELPIIEGEYECLGVLSTQTALSMNKETGEMGEEYVISKRVAFRKVIDGTRVLGDELCNLYFGSKGLYSIRMELYNYEKTGEMEMLSLEEAIEKVKSPDAFSIEGENEEMLDGIADTLCIERVKLLYVNQYADGCTILQPVFNLMGTAENENGSVAFSSKVIAIPEKYTYEED